MKAISLWSFHSKLMHMIIHNISCIFIYYYTRIWLNSLEDWRWKHTNTGIYWKIDWIWHYFRIMQQTLREICSSGVMVMELGCNWVLLSSQRLERLVNIILDITSFDCFSIDVPKTARNNIWFLTVQFLGWVYNH